MTDTTNDSSSKDILKSTGLIGGSKVITVLVGIARTKIVAVLLGPFGVGLVDLFQSLRAVISSVTSLGIGFSSVRDIAESLKKDDGKSIGRTVVVLYRWLWFTGIVGVIFTVIFSKQFSIYTFGDGSRSLEISILSIAVFFYTISGGQMAIIQGYREIGKLAKANVFSSILGFSITVPLYYFYGVKAIIPVLILVALATMALSWWYVQKIPIKKVSLSLKESFREGSTMVKLGFFTVITGFMSEATLYAIRAIIANRSDIHAVGLFAAASALSIKYMGVLLTAMSKDYFPRLSEVHGDDKKVNRLVNEQSFIALLLGVPLIIAMYTFLKPMLIVLYSSKFIDAIPLLQWMLIGSFIKLLGWPIGYVFLSKAKGKTFVFTQSLWNGFYFVLVLLGWNYYQVEGVGLAFAVASFLAYGANLIILKRLTNFKYDYNLLKVIPLFTLFMVFAFISSRYISGLMGYIFLGVNLLASIIVAYKYLNKIISIKKFFSKFFNK